MNNDKEHQFELLVRQHKRTIYTVCYMFSRNRVALNTAINQDKKERRRIETVPLTVDIDPYEADDPKTQQIRELYDRISRLDLIDRSLILLWLEGITYDEIGAIIGITPNNVGVRLARIKDKLVKMSKNK